MARIIGSAGSLIVYDGPSQLDGRPIVAVLTGLGRRSIGGAPMIATCRHCGCYIDTQDTDLQCSQRHGKPCQAKAERTWYVARLWTAERGERMAKSNALATLWTIAETHVNAGRTVTIRPAMGDDPRRGYALRVSNPNSHPSDWMFAPAGY